MKKSLALLFTALWLVGMVGGGSAGAADPGGAGTDPANPAVSGSFEPTRFSLPGGDTAYRVELPAGWRVTVQPDPHLALVTATSPEGARAILLFANNEPGRSLADWQALLTAAGARSGVTDIDAVEIDGRALITYRLRTGDIDSRCAVCRPEENWLTTLEFRATDGSADTAFSADDIRRVVTSLQPAE